MTPTNGDDPAPLGARLSMVVDALGAAGLDAIVCGLPSNVLMLTGYWPALGASIAIVTRDGAVGLLVPEDERDLIGDVAHNVVTYGTGIAIDLRRPDQAVLAPLGELAGRLGASRGRIGWEGGAAWEPAPFASMHLYGSSLARMIGRTVFGASLHDASETIARLRAVLTEAERAHVRRACAMADRAFTDGVTRIRPDMREPDLAQMIRGRLTTIGEREGVTRADGMVSCVAGPRSANAYRMVVTSTARRAAPGDLVVLRSQSYVDGFWVDITRTVCIGAPDMVQQAMYAAVFEARAAALHAIRPGALAAAVDGAARDVLTRLGFADMPRHGLGHGVGFSTGDPHALPRIHAGSPDVLAPGMVVTIDPAVYVPRTGGVRHGDVVVVTEDGSELLTDFLAAPEALVV
jgi:Xaa-Pro aminopeptidase